MLEWVWQNSERLSQLATVATGLAAIFALVIAGWQVKKARESQQRATAYQIYTEFLLNSLRHSEFLNPPINESDVALQIWNEDTKKFQEYEVYVDLMIAAFEEILAVYGSGAQIESYLRSYLDAHVVYLCSPRFREHESELAPAFRALYRKAYIEAMSKSVVGTPALATTTR